MEISNFFIGSKTINIYSHESALILAYRCAIPLNAIMLLGFFYSGSNGLPNALAIIYMFVSSIFLFYLLFIVNFKIVQLDLKTWIKVTLAVSSSVLITATLSVIFTRILFLINPVNESVIDRYIVINLIKDMMSVMIVQIIILVINLYKQEKEAAIDREKFLTENIRTRYEVLKSQVNPHFIFNSLNTLDGLIGINDDGAHEYLHNFSSVFRYVLNNKEITLLSNELTFTESYAAMLKIRYGDNFSIDYNINEKYKTWLIMPVSLQLLVENATKHNVISRNFPLQITIETTPYDTIRVKNHINMKIEPEQSEGIGLANLTDRYRLLFKKEVKITQTDLFCVEIPLIKQLESGVILTS